MSYRRLIGGLLMIVCSLLLIPSGSSILPSKKTDNAHVLIIYEAEDLSTYPASQSLIFKSIEFREWLDSKTSETGGGENSRIWDKDVETKYVDKIWKDATQQAVESSQGQLPWIVISDGQKGVFSGPLPVTIEAAKELISRHVK